MFTTPINATGKLAPSLKGPEGPAPTVSDETLPTVMLPGEARPKTQAAPLSEDKVQVSPDAAALASPEVVETEAEQNKPTPQEKYTEHIRSIIDEAQGRVTSVQFQIDTEGGEVVVRVVNKESGETLREIPSEEMRNLRAHLREMKGILFQEVS